MELEKHISDLLYRYPCVTVPGFGAFIAEIVTASIAGPSFFPPKKTIQFNPNIKNNDGLLVNHLALQEHIAYSAALQKINETVLIWQETLHDRSRLHLPKIGEIYFNQDFNLAFEQETATNYLTSSFGLQPFVSPLVSRENTMVEATDETTEPIQLPITVDKKSVPYLRYAAVAAVFVSMSGIAYFNYTQEQLKANQLVMEQQVQKKVNESIQKATFLIPTPNWNAIKTTKTESAKEFGKFHIVASAFRNTENAETAILELKAAGFEQARMLPKNREGLYQVVYESFKTIEEAQEQQKFIQSIHNPEAWMLLE